MSRSLEIAKTEVMQLIRTRLSKSCDQKEIDAFEDEHQILAQEIGDLVWDDDEICVSRSTIELWAAGTNALLEVQ